MHAYRHASETTNHEHKNMTTKPYEAAPVLALAKARKLGRQKGGACADTQYLPGGGCDTARDAAGRARALLAAYDDGDPAVDETFQLPDWLSGEWADEPTPADIAEQCGIDPDRDTDGTVEQEIADAYVQAADTAYREIILRHLRSVAKGD